MCDYELQDINLRVNHQLDNINEGIYSCFDSYFIDFIGTITS